jgi:hypothetical protein
MHRRIVRRVWLLLLVWSLPRTPLVAQLAPAPLPLSNTEDARTLPRGTFRLRALTAWTRIDAVYGALGDSAHGARPLGTLFGAYDLGTREIPLLSQAEAALRTLTGNSSLALDVGRLVTTADSRIVITPLALEYGLTSRLTIGVMVPVVQTHTTVLVQLNPRALGNNANVGPNPARPGNAASQANSALIGALDNARADLHSFVDACAANPGSCSAQRIAEATAAILRDSSYASALAVLYGKAAEGSPFVPLGDAQAAVAAQLLSLQTDVNAVLGANRYAFDAPAGANGVAALDQFRALATDPLGAAYDSLGSPDRIGIGDVEVSAALRLMDSFGDTITKGGVRYRAAVRGVLRLGTGQPSYGTVPFEVGTGTGQTSADGAAFLDLRIRPRFMTTFGGQYTAYFGTAKIDRVPGNEFSAFPLGVPVAGSWRAGNAIQAEATPRYLLTDYFTLHGHYAFRRQEGSSFSSPNSTNAPLFAASMEQRVGFGFAYSTLARYARGRASIPIEVLYAHLETIAGSGGLTPKLAREQIELRIYYRFRRAGR